LGELYIKSGTPSKILKSSIVLKILVILNSLNIRSHDFLAKMPQESTEIVGVEVLEEDDSVPHPHDVCICS
jgi:hypothetical protein